MAPPALPPRPHRAASSRATAAGLAAALALFAASVLVAASALAAPLTTGVPPHVPSPAVVAPGLLQFGQPACALEGAGARVVNGAVQADADGAPRWLRVTVGPECADTREVFVTPELILSEGEATLHLPSGLLEINGETLRGVHIVLIDPQRGPVGIAACAGAKTCAATLSPERREALLAGRLLVVLWPESPGLRGDVVPVPYGVDGAPMPWAALALPPPRVELSALLLPNGALELGADAITLPLPDASAVADVKCRRARCALLADGLQIFAIERTALGVRVQLDYREGVQRREGGRLVGGEAHELEISRCRLRPAPAPLLAGLADHRFVLGVARDCHRGAWSALAVETHPPSSVWVRGELPTSDPNWRLLEIAFDRVPSGTERLRLTVSRREPSQIVLGAVEIPVRADFQPAVVRLFVPEFGPVDFIPINRAAHAEVIFDEPAWAERVRIAPRPGFYGVPAEGQVMAAEGASGAVSLRFLYAPPEVTAWIGHELPLARFDTDARYGLRTLNIPLALGDGERPIVRVECRHDEQPVSVRPGRTTAISHRERESCRLVLDRASIPREAGRQLLRINADGSEQVVSLDPSGGPLEVALAAGEKKEFDVLRVTVSHEYGTGHYDFAPRQNLGAGVRYRVLLGDSPLRVSVSTSLPTGLFRFGAEADRGAVPLSAGGIGRIAYLYKEGQEFPFGLEMGLFGTGLSGDPNLSIVSGVGFSVPVLNPDTPLQASFNLHAWVEYSPTRDAPGSSPWAFLFGPSFGIGRFSTNL